MSTHPDLVTALAYERIADHQAWAARRRPAGRRRSRRSIIQVLARWGRRPASPSVAGRGAVRPIPTVAASG